MASIATACATTGAATGPDPRRICLSIHRQLGSVRSHRATAVCQHQLRHGPRRLHAQRSGSYNEKHNEANGEDNRDGESRQPFLELRRGRTDRRPGGDALRERQKRNFLATLFLSQGVPMLLGGDEIGRTQQGNNNAYCQDNEISWFDWEISRRDLLEFTRRADRLSQAAPSFPHGAVGFRAVPFMAPKSPISRGLCRTAWRWPRSIGARASRKPSEFF